MPSEVLQETEPSQHRVLLLFEEVFKGKFLSPAKFMDFSRQESSAEVMVLRLDFLKEMQNTFSRKVIPTVGYMSSHSRQCVVAVRGEGKQSPVDVACSVRNVVHFFNVGNNECHPERTLSIETIGCRPIAHLAASTDTERSVLYCADDRGIVSAHSWGADLHDTSSSPPLKHRRVASSFPTLMGPQICASWCGLAVKGDTVVCVRQMAQDATVYVKETPTLLIPIQYYPTGVALLTEFDLLAVCENFDIALYDVRASKKCVQRVRCGTDVLLAVSDGPPGEILAGGFARAVSTIDSKKWQVRNAVPNVLKYELNMLSLIPGAKDDVSGSLVVVAGADSEMRLVGMQTKKVVHEMHADDVWVGPPCHDRRVVAGVSSVGTLVVSDFR